MILPPLDKFRISFYAISDHRLIIFDPHDVLIVGSLVFKFQDSAAGFGGENFLYPLGNVLKVAVKLRTFQYLDHVDLPLFVVKKQPDVKFQTGFFCGCKIAKFHAGDG